VPRDQLKDIYPYNYYSFSAGFVHSPIFAAKDWLDRRFFKRFVSVLPHPQINVLDVGGGAGLALSSFKKIDRRIKRSVIVDIDKRAGDVARKLGHEYFCGRFEDFPPDQTFEIILMLNLIEHVENPAALLSKAQKQLSHGGLVILKTPNIDSLDARLFRRRNWGGYHCPRHWILFDRRSLERLVNNSGLRIKRLEYTQGASFWTTSVLFQLSRKGWIHVSAKRPALNHPLYGPLCIVFAGIDFARGLFAKTSQMLVVLEHDR